MGNTRAPAGKINPPRSSSLTAAILAVMRHVTNTATTTVNQTEYRVLLSLGVACAILPPCWRSRLKTRHNALKSAGRRSDLSCFRSLQAAWVDIFSLLLNDSLHKRHRYAY